MTRQEILTQIEKLDKGINNSLVADSLKAQMRNKKAELQSQLDKLKSIEQAEKIVERKKTTTPSQVKQKSVAKKTAVAKKQAVKNNVKKTIAEAKSILDSLPKKVKEFNKGRSKDEIENDARVKALKAGKRVSKSGHSNQYGVSEGGNVYYENRPNRSDVSNKRKPYLERGGELDTNFYKEGSNKYGLGNTEIFIHENESGFDVYDNLWDEQTGSWNITKLSNFDTMEEAKEFAIKQSKKVIADRYSRLTEKEANRLDELTEKVSINEQTESEDKEFDRLVHKYRGWEYKYAKGGKLSNKGAYLNAPQGENYTRYEDSKESNRAKPAGWRYTNAGAKRLKLKAPNQLVSKDHLQKYRGKYFTDSKGVKHRYIYIERRADKSDVKRGFPYLEKGGSIPNNYEGKTAEQVWNEWSEGQREHFLTDHKKYLDFIGDTEIWASMGYEKLKSYAKGNFGQIETVLNLHISEGQYEKGGEMYAKAGATVGIMQHLQTKSVKNKYGDMIYTDLDNAMKMNPKNLDELIDNLEKNKIDFRGWSGEEFKIKRKKDIQQAINYVKDYSDNLEIKKSLLFFKDTATNEQGGELPKKLYVKVMFENPKYNYTTYINKSISDEEIRSYFKIGRHFNVGVGGNDDMQPIKDIEIVREYQKGGGLYAKGGLFGENQYNTGRSWHQDRARHNKSEDWEKPLSERKGYEDGGELTNMEIAETALKVYVKPSKKEGKALFKQGEAICVVYDNGDTEWVGEDDILKMEEGSIDAELPIDELQNQNINVFGYETQNFDVSEHAASSFLEAISKIGEEDNERAKESLVRAAKHLDSILFKVKVKEEALSEFVEKSNVKILVNDIQMFAYNNYTSGLNIPMDLVSSICADILELDVDSEKVYEYGGTMYALGGMTVGRWYRDNTGEELRYIGKSDVTGEHIFSDGTKRVTRTEQDFEGKKAKESKLFGWFEDGGEMYAKGGTIDTDTPIIPEMIAESVAREKYFEKNAVPKANEKAAIEKADKTITALESHLVDKANDFYKRSEHFKTKVNGKGSSGRDYLYTIMAHWSDAFLNKKESGGEMFSKGGSVDKIISLYEEDTDSKGEFFRLKAQALFSEEKLDKYKERAKKETMEFIDKGQYMKVVNVYVHPKNAREPYLDKYKVSWVDEKEQGGEMKWGGRTTFDEKVDAIASSLKGKNVKPKYQKQYGKKYDKQESIEAATKIAGAMASKGKMKKGVKA